MANHTMRMPPWTWAAPLLAWLVYGLHFLTAHPAMDALIGTALIAAVLAAVHHAEVVAHRVGEPFGTLVLACAVTVIEVALIVALMIAAGDAVSSLARDTVFSAVMIILNGIIGLCLLVGGSRHREQNFGLRGVSASLATLAALLSLTLILPNYTTTVPGPQYAPSQLGFVAAVSLVLYFAFVLVQTVRHREYFLPAAGSAEPAAPPPARLAWISAALLVASLVVVVLLAKSLAPTLERALAAAGAPKSVLGVVIAALVLLPEGLAAVRAAAANRLQTSLNLALGSAIATIGLTIPTVAIVSLATGWTLVLGLEGKDMVLLALSLFIATLSLGTGRTTVLQGVIHLVIFAVYLFTTVVP